LNVKIVPALLTNNQHEFVELQKKLSFAPLIQLDIMDGAFVPSCSISIEILKQHPFLSPFEVHLMTYHPEVYFKDFKDMGASGVVFHAESTDNISLVIEEAKALDLKVSLAINPDTAHSILNHYIENVDSVLFMTVYPGFYGAKFEDRVLKKIQQFRTLYPQATIAIDGGVKESNIAKIRKAGINIICVGSAIVKAADAEMAYQKLQHLANS